MKTNVPEMIRADPRLPAAVERATSFLESAVGPSTKLVTADWSLAENGDKAPVLNLRISDYSGAVAGRFAPDEMKDPYRLEGRLNRLWDDLLRVRVDTLLEKLRKDLAEMEKE